VKKISNAELLTVIVFLPPAKNPVLKTLRKIASCFLNFGGKILGAIL
jgi:hypothetical protein